ncbi:conserved protein of unknown function [Methylotuvimicrobium alcaliphilum 20Z]|uniref:Cysteine-rich CPCC domain-containing protein n=1 Tax=Methylotuvimicrobium alcaliphilum (strain DSM 19304 / NCIMB 14124 / VKM B-2133 / 20Z) TaxID=1091494 RepID=G4ST54_META2|nr:conserved protein of unknown function [Methylotuvimicrobium alcaliphilum 20Z]
MKIEYCPLCGWGPLEKPYESMEELWFSYDICDCCGCEYGLDDNEPYYEKWVSEGCRWLYPEAKPTGWRLQDQLQHQIRPWPPNPLT